MIKVDFGSAITRDKKEAWEATEGNELIQAIYRLFK